MKIKNKTKVLFGAGFVYGVLDSFDIPNNKSYLYIGGGLNVAKPIIKYGYLGFREGCDEFDFLLKTIPKDNNYGKKKWVKLNSKTYQEVKDNSLKARIEDKIENKSDKIKHGFICLLDKEVSNLKMKKGIENLLYTTTDIGFGYIVGYISGNITKGIYNIFL